MKTTRTLPRAHQSTRGISLIADSFSWNLGYRWSDVDKVRLDAYGLRTDYGYRQPKEYA